MPSSQPTIVWSQICYDKYECVGMNINAVYVYSYCYKWNYDINSTYIYGDSACSKSYSIVNYLHVNGIYVYSSLGSAYVNNLESDYHVYANSMGAIAYNKLNKISKADGEIYCHGDMYILCRL